jgi:hypothetical protein
MTSHFHDRGRLENVYDGDPADDSVHPDDHTVTEPEPMPETTETIDDIAQRYFVNTAVNDACAPLQARIRAQELRIVSLIVFLDETLRELRRVDPRMADVMAGLSAHVRRGVDG